MLFSSYTKTLSDYFGHSQQFCYIIANSKGNFIYINPHFQKKINNISNEIGSISIASVFIEADKYYETIQECLNKPGQVVNAELTTRSKEDSIITIAWEFLAYTNDADNSIHIQAIGMAIDKKGAEEQLKFQAKLYNNISDAVTSSNKNFIITSWNKGAEEIYGIRAEEILGKKLIDFVKINYHPLTRDEVIKIIYEKGVWKGEVSFVRRTDQSTRMLLTTITLQYDEYNIPSGVVSVNKDITEQKLLSQRLIEQEIQKQKQLTQATIDGQEKERLEIGKELHDNISQHLTITRLYLEVIKEKEPHEIHDIINHAHKNLSGIINKIRHLSQSLVPPTLGDIGLIESVQEICDSLKRTHTFNMDFYYRHFNEETLPDNLKLMLFRIIQEQINNIIRHAHADTIQIRLQSDAEHIILIIADNGKGFDISNYKKGLGLANITNRAGLFNGKVEIDTFPGKGCSLCVAIPSSVTGWQDMN